MGACVLSAVRVARSIARRISSRCRWQRAAVTAWPACLIVAAALVTTSLRGEARAALIIDASTTIDYTIPFDQGPVEIVDGAAPPTVVDVIDGAAISADTNVRGQSVLNIRGGSVGFTTGYDNAVINVFAGANLEGQELQPTDNSVVNFFGGKLNDDLVISGGVANVYAIRFWDDLIAVRSGVVNLYGGCFDCATDSPTLIAGQDGQINVFLLQFQIVPMPIGDRLVGTLSDGSPIDLYVWVDPFELGIAQITFTIVPEPSVCVLLITGVACGALWRVRGLGAVRPS